MKKLSQQAMCNRVVRHLYKQKVACLSETGGCNIRSSDGKMCAAGAALPRAVAKAQTGQGTSAEWFRVQREYPIVESLRDVHDNAAGRPGGVVSRRAIREAVARHGLKMPDVRGL